MTKIIDFKKEAEQLKGPVAVRYAVRRKTYHCTCPHKHVMLDYNGRLLQCDDCGEYIDSFDFIVEYSERQRKTELQIARWEAAKAEFERIESEWNLTTREKRRIQKVMEDARYNNE